MATDLGLDPDLAAVEAVDGSAVGWAGKVEAALRAALGSATNPFGSASRRDVGAAPGNIPVLGVDGQLAAGVVPAPEVDPAMLIPSAVAVATLAAEARATFDTLDGPDTYYDLVGGDVRVKAAGIYVANAYINGDPRTASFRQIQLLAGPAGNQLVIAEHDAAAFARATITAFWTAAANERIGASITGIDTGEQATFTLGMVRLR